MSRRRLSHRVGPLLGGLLGPLLVRALGRTWRIRFDPPDLRERVLRRDPAVYALWHGRLLVPTYALRGAGAAVMISRHADGEVIARICERMGFTTVRGSSTRGGAVALHDAVEALRSGRAAAFTPDGPKGPRERLQPGAVFAASRAGVPLVPLGIGSSRAWEFRSWDRFRVPKPFARVALVAGEPLRFDPGIEGEALAREVARAEAALRNACARAEEAAGQPPSPL
jgi:lysophospholipid acyltransferase (LPLAT)-like uncharacterized protein